MLDFGAIKTRKQAIRADGDFGLIDWNSVLAGELLGEAVDPRAGQRVLDVDYVPALLERAAAGRQDRPCQLDARGHVEPAVRPAWMLPAPEG